MIHRGAGCRLSRRCLITTKRAAARQLRPPGTDSGTARPDALPQVAHRGAPAGSQSAKVLEDAGITLASVASDILGQSGRAVLSASNAAEAVAHSLLRTIYHVIASGQEYHNLGPDYCERR